jgi:hypothetical protein
MSTAGSSNSGMQSAATGNNSATMSTAMIHKDRRPTH